MAAPAPKGKGKMGKGPLPPPGVAKGKGKAAMHVSEPLKGGGKGKHGINTEPVPENLCAPGAQRIHMAPLRPMGQVWESLRPWHADGVDILECLSIDYDELLGQWALAPVTAAVQVPVDRLLLDRHRIQNLEIAMRGAALTPDLVQNALTEDFDLLTLDQAQALLEVVIPASLEARGSLHALVQREGVASLRDVERLLWTVENIPQAFHLARFAKARLTLSESLDVACSQVHALSELVEELTTSRTLKNTLQVCLVASNVLSQTGNPRLRIDQLPELRLRKIQPNAPSILTIVARNLQRQHEDRCRLRFLRMFAVGASPINEVAKKLTWLYLDDLQASPWDVLGILGKCTKWNLPDQVEVLRVEKACWLDLLSAIRQFHLVGGSPHSRIEQQINLLNASLEEATTTIQMCEERLPAMAHDLIGFFGDTGRFRDDAVKSAAEILRHLLAFGNYLELEKRMWKSAPQTSRSWQRGQRWGAWTQVDTDCAILHITKDPNLIRSLRAPKAGLVATLRTSDVAASTIVNDPNDEGQQTALQLPSEQPLTQLLHGGPDGEYRRCPLTGKWQPIGYAAIAAERDCGTRGAVSGFFSTF